MAATEPLDKALIRQRWHTLARERAELGGRLWDRDNQDRWDALETESDQLLDAWLLATPRIPQQRQGD